MTTPITTTTQLEALPEQSVILDTWGDVGIISDGYVHYPETEPVAFEVALTWAPLTALWPIPAPTVKPGRDELARTIDPRPWSERHRPFRDFAEARTTAELVERDRESVRRIADDVLAILPGKTEQEVRAEALRDAQQVIAGEDSIAWARTASGSHIMLDHAIGMIDDLIADEEAGK